MLSDNVRRWVERATGSRVVRVSRMRGATSSRLDDIEIENGSGPRHVVLRRFVDEAWVRREPDLAIREGVRLQHAGRAGWPAPTSIAVDVTGQPCGTPATRGEESPRAVMPGPQH